jgi:hypothetical protein
LARRLVNQQEFKDLTGREERIQFLYERIYQREPTDVEIKLGDRYIEESPAPEQITEASREEAQQQRDARQNPKPGMKKGGRSMTMASLGPRQLRPIGTWVKYTHILLQANEAIFIN